MPCFVSYRTTILLFALLSIPTWRWLRGRIIKAAAWFVPWCSFVATLLSKARVNFSFSLTFSINLIIIFQNNLDGNISPGQCWRSNFISAQCWGGFWLCSGAGSAVSDVFLLKAVWAPYLTWLPWMCSKLCVLENKTFLNGMAHSRWPRSVSIIPAPLGTCAIPFPHCGWCLCRDHVEAWRHTLALRK